MLFYSRKTRFPSPCQTWAVVARQWTQKPQPHHQTQPILQIPKLQCNSGRFCIPTKKTKGPSAVSKGTQIDQKRNYQKNIILQGKVKVTKDNRSTNPLNSITLSITSTRSKTDLRVNLRFTSNFWRFCTPIKKTRGPSKKATNRTANF